MCHGVCVCVFIGVAMCMCVLKFKLGQAIDFAFLLKILL